jgi:hypothetical protein
MARGHGSFPSEVFLSHSSRDRTFASRLAATVRRHGVPVWYSSTNIVGAQQWHDEIGCALQRCDWFVVILSPSSVRSAWVKRELVCALNDRRYTDRIVPLLFRACDPSRLSWTLGGFQTVDFTSGYGRGCRELLRIWGLGFDRREARTAGRRKTNRRRRSKLRRRS